MLQLMIEYVQCYWQSFVMGMIFMSIVIRMKRAEV
jgi:hypothetical protein